MKSKDFLQQAQSKIETREITQVFSGGKRRWMGCVCQTVNWIVVCPFCGKKLDVYKFSFCGVGKKCVCGAKLKGNTATRLFRKDAERKDRAAESVASTDAMTHCVTHHPENDAFGDASSNQPTEVDIDERVA